MNKKQIIWRDILHSAFQEKKLQWTQKELAQKYNLSLSTVFNALKAPRKSNLINVGGRGFKLQDAEKFLYLWATFRDVEKDIIYKTHVPKSVSELEAEMIPEAIFGAYNAYHEKYDEAPADYDKAYIYLNEQDLEKLKKRFPPEEDYENLIVLKADPWLENFGNFTPDCQIFVDLWNLPEWYAKEFLNALKDRLF